MLERTGLKNLLPFDSEKIINPRRAKKADVLRTPTVSAENQIESNIAIKNIEILRSPKSIFIGITSPTYLKKLSYVLPESVTSLR